MKKQLKILGILFLTLIAWLIFMLVIAGSLVAAFRIQGVASLIVLFIFISIIFFTRKTSGSATVVTITSFICSFFGMFFDTWGNFIFNKPLEWLLSPWGQLSITQNTFNYAPGSYSITNSLFLKMADGQTQKLSIFILYGYRFIQYLILLLIVGNLVRKIPYKKGSVKAEQDIVSSILSDQEMQEVLRLLKDGKKVEAVKLVQTTSKLSLKSCKKYVYWLETELKE